MNILVIDTAGPWCAAGVRRADGAVFERTEKIGRGHAEILAPMVRDLLNEAGLAPRELGRIGVATGPGSFAGTRVGVAFARGLALASGAKPVGISSLAAWARRADPDRKETLAVIHDAKRGELLWQIFTQGEAVTEPQRGGEEEARAEFIEYGDLDMTGSGAALLGADPAHFSDEPALSALITLTEEAPGDAPLPAPIYARPPDAKLPGGIEPEPQA